MNLLIPAKLNSGDVDAEASHGAFSLNGPFQQPVRRRPSGLRFAGGQMDRNAPMEPLNHRSRIAQSPTSRSESTDELETRFNSQGLDGVLSPAIERDLHAARERGYYYLRMARRRLKEAQVGAGYILVSAESAAQYSANHGNWPHTRSAQYQDPEAVKLERATNELGALENLEIALIEDEQRKAPLLSSASRNDLLSRSSGYVALLSSYAACKLNGVVSGKKTPTVIH